MAVGDRPPRCCLSPSIQQTGNGGRRPPHHSLMSNLLRVVFAASDRGRLAPLDLPHDPLSWQRPLEVIRFEAQHCQKDVGEKWVL